MGLSSPLVTAYVLALGKTPSTFILFRQGEFDKECGAFSRANLCRNARAIT
jgi:hypothetical protein